MALAGVHELGTSRIDHGHHLARVSVSVRARAWARVRARA